MKVFNGIDTGMVTDFVASLPNYCLHCSGKCWPSGSYPHACRCSQCSAYFHLEFRTCDDLVLDGYCTSLCTDSHTPANLRIIELADGTLAEACPSCVTWLLEEGYLDGCFNSGSFDGATNKFDRDL